MKRTALIAPLLLWSSLYIASASTWARGAETHAATGTLRGVLIDATSRKPLPSALVTVGYLTHGFQRAAMTDAHGRYVISGLPVTRGIDTYAFAQGYIYHHGVNQVITAGHTTVYSYALPRDGFTSIKHPTITSYYAHAMSNGTARLGMVAVQGDDAFSFEMMAIAPQLGLLVVLKHGLGKHYDGTLTVPKGTKPGRYRFYYVATQNNCFENRRFPHLDLHLR